MLYQFLQTLKTIVLFGIRKAEELLQDFQLRIVQFIFRFRGLFISKQEREFHSF